MAACMCRPVPASWRIPIRRPSSKNASTKPRRCSGRPKKRAGLHQRRAADSKPPACHRSPASDKTALGGYTRVMILLIDNYDSFTFNLVHYLGGLGADVVVRRNDKVTVNEVIAAQPEAIVLS